MKHRPDGLSQAEIPLPARRLAAFKDISNKFRFLEVALLQPHEDLLAEQRLDFDTKRHTLGFLGGSEYHTPAGEGVADYVPGIRMIKDRLRVELNGLLRWVNPLGLQRHLGFPNGSLTVHTLLNEA